jgi:hypothetical protein
MTKPKLDREIVSQLRDSKATVGPLIPIFTDSEGKIIDGRHRIAADKSWPTQRLQLNKRQSLTARIALNTIRHPASSADFNELAKLLKREGVPRDKIASTIARETGLSQTCVTTHLRPEYKRPAAPDVERWTKPKTFTKSAAYAEPYRPVGPATGSVEVLKRSILAMEKAAEPISNMPTGKLSKCWNEFGLDYRTQLKAKLMFVSEQLKKLQEITGSAS